MFKRKFLFIENVLTDLSSHVQVNAILQIRPDTVIYLQYIIIGETSIEVTHLGLVQVVELNGIGFSGFGCSLMSYLI